MKGCGCPIHQTSEQKKEKKQTVSRDHTHKNKLMHPDQIKNSMEMFIIHKIIIYTLHFLKHIFLNHVLWFRKMWVKKGKIDYINCYLKTVT